MTDMMIKANAKATRLAVEAMQEAELREAVKAIPSDILVEELWARLRFSEDRSAAYTKLAIARR